MYLYVLSMAFRKDTFFDLTLSTYILCLYVSLKKHEEYNVCTVLHVLMYLYIELDKKKIL